MARNGSFKTSGSEIRRKLDNGFLQNLSTKNCAADFVFGANKNPADKDTMLVCARFSQAGLVDWKIVPAKISSVPHMNDYRPTLVNSDAEKARILKKVGLGK